MEDRLVGKVKWFDPAKGFGFIAREDGADVFVHYSEIEMEGFSTLEQGEDVEFTLVEGAKGPKATQVVRVAAG
jgi:CspA family cold shock protein